MFESQGFFERRRVYFSQSVDAKSERVLWGKERKYARVSGEDKTGQVSVRVNERGKRSEKTERVCGYFDPPSAVRRVSGGSEAGAEKMTEVRSSN